MKILSIIILALTILFFFCNTEPKSNLYKSNHKLGSPRESIPFQDFDKKLMLDYNTIKDDYLYNKLLIERYQALKEIGNNEYIADIVIGRDTLDRILFLEEFLSEFYNDKDYERIQTHYFDEYGFTFAIEQHTNSICENDDAHQTIIECFDSKFNLITNSCYLVRTSGEILDKEVCGSDYDEALGKYKTFEDLVETYSEVKEE